MPGSLHVFLPSVHSGRGELMASEQLSKRPDSGERAEQASGEQGNPDSYEQKVSSLGTCFISAASVQIQGRHLISYPDRQWNRSLRDEQSTCISHQVENGVYYVPKPKYLVYRVERRDTAIASDLRVFWFSLCSCGM